MPWEAFKNALRTSQPMAFHFEQFNILINHFHCAKCMLAWQRSGEVKKKLIVTYTVSQGLKHFCKLETKFYLITEYVCTYIKMNRFVYKLSSSRYYLLLTLKAFPLSKLFKNSYYLKLILNELKLINKSDIIFLVTFIDDNARLL